MPTIGSLRNTIRTDYLKNDVISGREARDLVRRVAKEGLTGAGQAQLEKLRDEFKDRFSDAGMREFEKALGKAIDKSPSLGGAPAGDGQSAVSVRAGVNLENVPTAFKLSEIKDYDVKKALRRIDLNLDGKVDDKDRKSAGFSDEQFRMYIFAATLMGVEMDTSVELPSDLSGKTICFTAIADKPQAKAWAEAMGAKVVSKVSEDLDFLVVGASGSTGKDERANILNTLGLADITVANHGAFLNAAHRADVTGPGPDRLTQQEFHDILVRDMKGFYEEFLEGAYEDELSYATTDTQRAEIKDNWEADKDNFDFMIDAPNDSWIDWVADKYANNEPYLDRFGVPIPEDEIEIFDFYFSPDVAGIGLSKVFIYDRRTGECLDEGDVQD